MVLGVYPLANSIRPSGTANQKILLNDVILTEADFPNAGAGTIRLYFCANFGSDFQMSITTKGTTGDNLNSPLKLNGESSFTIKDGGYYRFDIGVQAGDRFNLSTDKAFTNTQISELKLHKIVAGA